MVTFHNIEQGTEEWFQLRARLYTSSNFDAIMAHSVTVKGFDAEAKFGTNAVKYAQKKAVEQLTGKPVSDDFKNPWMDRGNLFESEAAEDYENKNVVIISPGGFYEDGIHGDSPDFNVGDVGCGEIKTRKYNIHFDCIQSGKPSSATKWQYQGHLWLGEKEWCDYVSFCPEFPEDSRSYIIRVERNEEGIMQLQQRLKQFDKLVKHFKSIIS